ncbi:MAG: peptidoglycan DD-metalloendopeptidase family protein [Lachnospiraceae bacterium]|nr:peptidoglycan DD-metalloendopeptidase family protein [Lachnospiraceae bacterium]
MSKKVWLGTRVALIFVVIGYLSFSLVDKKYGANLEDEKKKQEQMQEELKDTQALLKELEGLKGDTEKYITKLDTRMNELADNIYDLEQSVSAQKLAIEETKVSITEAQKEIDAQYEAMKLRIQYMYENGEFSYLAMIFNSDSMEEMLNRAEYLGQITSYDREQLTKFEQAKADLDAKELKLENELANLEATLAEIEEEQNATEKLLAVKQEELSEHIHDIESTENDIQHMESDIETQKAIVAELEEIERKRKEQEALNALKKLTYDGGTMTWPLPGYSRLSSYFGTRPNPFGQPTQEYHSGIDVPAPKGTKIVAAYDGEVAWSYYSSSAGNWVGIDHGDGIYTVYMHMSKRLVSEGDMVKKGDVIGLVGTTGRSTGNHLHFGVRKDGKYVDPLDWVSP